MEETKRRKLAIKAQKIVELMMVSGIPTASGYEERIRFSEMEVVDRGAQEQGLLVNVPEGHFINGWDVNIAGVRTTSIKRNIRYHQHAVSARIRDDCVDLTACRSSSYESNAQVVQILSLAEDTASSQNYIDGYGWSSRARFYLHYQERTKVQRRQVC